MDLIANCIESFSVFHQYVLHRNQGLSHCDKIHFMWKWIWLHTGLGYSVSFSNMGYIIIRALARILRLSIIFEMSTCLKKVDAAWKTQVECAAPCSIRSIIKMWLSISQTIMCQHASTPSIKTRKKHTEQYNIISTRSDTYKHSFYPSVIPVWNQLPASIITSPTAPVFKNQIQEAVCSGQPEVFIGSVMPATVSTRD